MAKSARFALSEPVAVSSVPGLNLRPFHLQRLGSATRRVTLLDTPDGALARAGFALWHTFSDAAAHVTLAFARAAAVNDSPPGAIRAPCDAAAPDAGWPEPFARAVAAITGGAPVVALAGTEVIRTVWMMMYRGNPIGQLVYDEGTLRVGTREQPVRELEIAVRPEADVVVGDILERRLRKAVDVRAAPGSELERLLAALPERDATGGATPLWRIARRHLRRAANRLRATEDGVRAARDPEAIHEMRTATRQLRTFLATLEATGIYPRKDVRRVREALRGLADALGAARDLDMLAQHLAEYEQAQPWAVADLRPLRGVIRRERARAQRTLLAELADPLLAHRVEQLRRLTRHPNGARRRVLARHVAGAIIWRRYEAILAFERQMPEATPTDLHLLRIRCKQMRYTLHLFEQALDPDAAALGDLFTRAQDHLGGMQDHVTALGRLAPLLATHPENVALAAYATARAAERDRLVASFTPLWIELTGHETRQRLARLLAAL
jgi:CHAD domain-containing protein